MNRTIRNIFVLVLSALFLTFAGCRPKGILHSWEMRKIMVDLHKTDATLQIANLQSGYAEARTIYYAQVLEAHGTTQAEFDSSLVWYTAHPALFDKIYPRVLKQLEREEAEFLALHETELAAAAEPISEETVQEFRHADLDSVLWVTQHGCPTTWNPLVHDFEDEFFPQIGVSR